MQDSNCPKIHEDYTQLLDYLGSKNGVNDYNVAKFGNEQMV